MDYKLYKNQQPGNTYKQFNLILSISFWKGTLWVLACYSTHISAVVQIGETDYYKLRKPGGNEFNAVLSRYFLWKGSVKGIFVLDNVFVIPPTYWLCCRLENINYGNLAMDLILYSLEISFWKGILSFVWSNHNKKIGAHEKLAQIGMREYEWKYQQKHRTSCLD